VFQEGAQLFDSVQALASFVLTMPPISTYPDFLRQSRRIQSQRVRNRDYDPVPFLSLRVAECVQYRAAVHNLQRQASTARQNPSGLPQDGFVLVFGVEEAKRIHQDGTASTFGSKWQAPHVTANPTDPQTMFLGQVSRSIQQGDGEIEANDLGSALGKGERMTPMTATDVNDARRRRELEQVPKTANLSSHIIGWWQEPPALGVAPLKVLASPVGHVQVVPSV
jgi:hypothetical protein